MELATINMTSTAKIWIYQSDKDLSGLKNTIENLLRGFVSNWQSHGDALSAEAWIEQDRFIIVCVDESTASASGCSIDSSVHFMKKLEEQYGLSLFEKMNFAYIDEKKVKVADSTSFAQLYQSGEINEDTLVFDNLVKTYGDFKDNWIKPIKDSWHKRFV